jgi:hypothetical protein
VHQQDLPDRSKAAARLVGRRGLGDEAQLEEKIPTFDLNLTVEKNRVLVKVKMFRAPARQSLLQKVRQCICMLHI